MEPSRTSSPPLPIGLVAPRSPGRRSSNGGSVVTSVRAGAPKIVALQPYYGDNGEILYQIVDNVLEVVSTTMERASDVATLNNQIVPSQRRCNKRSAPWTTEFALGELQRYCGRQRAALATETSEAANAFERNLEPAMASSVNDGDIGGSAVPSSDNLATPTVPNTVPWNDEDPNNEDPDDGAPIPKSPVDNDFLPVDEAWITERLRFLDGGRIVESQRVKLIVKAAATVGSADTLRCWRDLLVAWRREGIIRQSYSLTLRPAEIRATWDRVVGEARQGNELEMEFVALYDLVSQTRIDYFLMAVLDRYRNAELHSVYLRMQEQAPKNGKRKSTAAKRSLFELLHNRSWKAAAGTQRNQYNDRLRWAKKWYMLRQAIGTGTLALSQICTNWLKKATEADVQVLGETVKMHHATAMEVGAAFLPLFTRAIRGNAVPTPLTNLEASDLAEPDLDSLGTAWFDPVDGDGSDDFQGSPERVAGTQLGGFEVVAANHVGMTRHDSVMQARAPPLSMDLPLGDMFTQTPDFGNDEFGWPGSGYASAWSQELNDLAL